MFTGVKKQEITIPAQSLLHEGWEGVWSIGMPDSSRFKGDPQMVLTTEIALDSQSQIEVFGCSCIPSSDALQRAEAKAPKAPDMLLTRFHSLRPILNVWIESRYSID